VIRTGGIEAPHFRLFPIQDALQQVEWSFGETGAWEDLQKVVIDHHREYLAGHGGVRSRKHDSYRIHIRPAELTAHRDEWSVLESRLQDDV
jgi:hypothetical protein